MMVHGCSSMSGGMSMNYQAHKTKPFTNSVSASSTHLPVKIAFVGIRSSLGPHQKLKSLSYQGTPILRLSRAPSPLSSVNQSGSRHPLFNLPQRRQVIVSPPRANNGLFPSKYPPMQKRPRFWWRILACIPYLMPFHETWMFAETAYNLTSFFAEFQWKTYPFLTALALMPRWFLLAYFITVYLGIVRRKEWPHFLRFHMCLGLLLEIALQVTGYVSNFLPLGVYWGKIGMYGWHAICWNHFLTVLVSCSCALAGVYADVPFFSDAAYIQIPYE